MAQELEYLKVIFAKVTFMNDFDPRSKLKMPKYWLKLLTSIIRGGL